MGRFRHSGGPFRFWVVLVASHIDYNNPTPTRGKKNSKAAEPLPARQSERCPSMSQVSTWLRCSSQRWTSQSPSSSEREISLNFTQLHWRPLEHLLQCLVRSSLLSDWRQAALLIHVQLLWRHYIQTNTDVATPCADTHTAVPLAPMHISGWLHFSKSNPQQYLLHSIVFSEFDDVFVRQFIECICTSKVFIAILWGFYQIVYYVCVLVKFLFLLYFFPVLTVRFLIINI